MSKITEQDKQMMERLSRRNLTEQEVFEAQQDLLGGISWLIEQDKKQNPHLYENN